MRSIPLWPEGLVVDREVRAPEEESGHGSPDLPSVRVESYNLEIKDRDGFVGDKASRGAFLDIIDELRKLGEDPLDGPTDALDKDEVDRLRREGSPAEAGLMHSAIEEFANRLTAVIRRYLKLKAWSEVGRVVVGGGFRQSRVGEVAIGRAAVLLNAAATGIDLVPIRHDPDEAGLIGCAHLAPTWMFEAYDSILGVDIGGSNIRCGIVRLNHDEAADLSRAVVCKSDLWKHADDDPARDEAIDRLADMLTGQIDTASAAKLRLAPFIGIGCPGMIDDDGFIERGAQNLPGNWESSRFNLVTSIKERIPSIGSHETMVLLHNDAVVQGLSEVPFMQDVERWGVLTIGTGLGNASYRNKRPRLSGREA